MKKNFLIIFIVTMVIVIGCKNNQMYEHDDVHMVIKEGTLTNHSATIIIVDNSEENNTYGEWLRIDKKENGKWKKLKSKNEWVNAPAFYVDENNRLELECNWKYFYGELDKGEYRLLKKVNNNKYISTNFIID